MALANGVVARLSTVYAGPEIVVCPSLVHTQLVARELEGSVVGLGAQDLAAQEPGAFTGAASAEQLREEGVSLCLVGHSERRQFFREQNDDMAGKLEAAFRVGITPVLCFGETREQREAGKTEEVVHEQLSAALPGLRPEQLAATVLAYEPVWAIGTGLHAAVDDAAAVHRLARGLLVEWGGSAVGDSARILYGGSVNAENVGGYLGDPEIDGALVGGASLNAESFVSIVCWQDRAV